MLFSQRQGHTPQQKELQLERVDDELRNRLWNLIDVHYWDNYRGGGVNNTVSNSNFETFIYQLWHNFFKWRIDEIPFRFRDALNTIRNNFFEFEWYRIYDFLEFIIKKRPTNIRGIDEFPSNCNILLEEENSGYRIIEGKVTPITSEAEMNSIEEALENSEPFPGVRTHLSTALSLLSDREDPDYRNSIKESISAVESACQTITGDSKASLGDALKKLEDHMHLHGAIKSGFQKLYGYTSDEDGIRHAILEEKNILFSDAKYMLIACTTFTNYLIAKVAEHNIKIPDRNT